MTDRYEERRQYVRHPIRVPLSVRLHDGLELVSQTGDVSEGGLSFACPRALEVGTCVDVDVPVNERRFKLVGTVRSCTALEGATFRVGLLFEGTTEHFRMKLAEQVLRIAQLQRELSESRGTQVTSREAAAAWVEQYAETFAKWYPPATD